VLAVVVGDRYTELESTQLGREQIRALQQIGAVQGEAEADSEQAGSGQGHPRSEVSVVSVDVLDLERRQLFCQRGSHYRVAQRTNAAGRGGAAFPHQGAATAARGCDDWRRAGRAP